MSIKVGINGFGRIGRLVMRAAQTNPQIQIVGVNDPFIPLDYMQYMLKYDTVHGRFPAPIGPNGDDSIMVDGNPIKVYAERDPSNINWSSCGADYVIESTGVFTKEDAAKARRPRGANGNAFKRTPPRHVGDSAETSRGGAAALAWMIPRSVPTPHRKPFALGDDSTPAGPPRGRREEGHHLGAVARRAHVRLRREPRGVTRPSRRSKRAIFAATATPPRHHRATAVTPPRRCRDAAAASAGTSRRWTSSPTRRARRTASRRWPR